jgi:hypothetical protein
VFKALVLLGSLLAFFQVSAQSTTTFSGSVSGSVSVTQEELKDCMDKGTGISLCKKMIRAKKRRDMVRKGFASTQDSAPNRVVTKESFSTTISGPVTISQEDLRKCISEGKGSVSLCRTKLTFEKRKEMARAKAESEGKLKREVELKVEDPVKEKRNPNCPFGVENQCKTYSDLVAMCIKKDMPAYKCRDKAKEIVDKTYKKDEDQEFQEFAIFSKCMKKLNSQEGAKSFCMRHAAREMAKKEKELQNVECDLAGQEQGTCNGFVYKRVDSSISDIERHLAGSVDKSDDPFGELDAEISASGIIDQ